MKRLRKPATRHVLPIRSALSSSSSRPTIYATWKTAWRTRNPNRNTPPYSSIATKVHLHSKGQVLVLEILSAPSTTASSWTNLLSDCIRHLCYPLNYATRKTLCGLKLFPFTIVGGIMTHSNAQLKGSNLVNLYAPQRTTLRYDSYHTFSKIVGHFRPRGSCLCCSVFVYIFVVYYESYPTDSLRRAKSLTRYNPLHGGF